MGSRASCMILAYSSGRLAARTTACHGPIPAAITTISSGKTIRIPNTAITMPQVRKRCCHFGCIVFSLLAFTMALSKDSEISSTARTVQMKRMPAIPPKVPVVCQPRAAPSARPMAVTMKAQRK